MRKMINKTFYKKIHGGFGGFILPLTLVITTIVVTVAVGVSNIILKQTIFSFLTRASSTAYYAADAGLACAIYIDDTYLDQLTGIGIMPHSRAIDPTLYINDTRISVNDYRTARGITTSLTLDNIVCGTTEIFDTPTSNFTSSPTFTYTKSDMTTELGRSNTFDMKMDIGDGTIRCANVTVRKTLTYRQIISRGYSKCDAGLSRIERAVISASERQ